MGGGSGSKRFLAIGMNKEQLVVRYECQCTEGKQRGVFIGWCLWVDMTGGMTGV